MHVVCRIGVGPGAAVATAAAEDCARRRAVAPSCRPSRQSASSASPAVAAAAAEQTTGAAASGRSTLATLVSQQDHQGQSSCPSPVAVPRATVAATAAEDAAWRLRIRQRRQLPLPTPVPCAAAAAGAAEETSAIHRHRSAAGTALYPRRRRVPNVAKFKPVSRDALPGPCAGAAETAGAAGQEARAAAAAFSTSALRWSPSLRRRCRRWHRMHRHCLRSSAFTAIGQAL